MEIVIAAGGIKQPARQGWKRHLAKTIEQPHLEAMPIDRRAEGMPRSLNSFAIAPRIVDGL
jgi:hypothetical protein